jgi:hypothetical protein
MTRRPLCKVACVAMLALSALSLTGCPGLAGPDVTGLWEFSAFTEAEGFEIFNDVLFLQPGGDAIFLSGDPDDPIVGTYTVRRNRLSIKATIDDDFLGTLPIVIEGLINEEADIFIGQLRVIAITFPALGGRLE